MLPSKAVVFTGTSGRIVGHSEKAAKQVFWDIPPVKSASRQLTANALPAYLTSGAHSKANAR